MLVVLLHVLIQLIAAIQNKLFDDLTIWDLASIRGNTVPRSSVVELISNNVKCYLCRSLQRYTYVASSGHKCRKAPRKDFKREADPRSLSSVWLLL